MPFLHRSRSVVLALLATGLLSACSAATDTPPLAGGPSPAPAATTGDDPLPTEPVETAPIVASWSPGAAPVDLGDGRTIGDCEGEVPALCVADGSGAVLGLLEAFRYPAPSELLGRSGGDLDTALREFAAARLTEVEQDRHVACGDDHAVLPDAPGTVTLGGLPGLRFGFATVQGDQVVEHVVTWATVHDGELRLVVAYAATPDGCMASELVTFPTDDLVTLLPVLDRVMAGTPVPL